VFYQLIYSSLLATSFQVTYTLLNVNIDHGRAEKPTDHKSQPDKIKSCDLAKERHFVKGVYTWDARFKGHESNNVILGAVTDYELITKRNGGIGIFVVDAFWSPVLNGDFRRWQEEQKGGPSRYSIVRELEGRPEHPRKSAYAFGKTLAYFFTLEDLRKGVEEGWMKDDWQATMRNSRG